MIMKGADRCSNFAAYWRSAFLYMHYIDMIWFAVAVLFLVTKAMLYVYTISSIKRKCFTIESDNWLDAFEKISMEQPKQNVVLVASNDTRSPFAVGIMQKYIVIPAIMINTLDEEEIDFILRHEYCHALRNDVARKVIIVIFSCLNWFNPLYFLLKANLSAWIEIACDEMVTKSFDERQRKKYAGLIIKVLSLQNVPKEKHFYCICYSGDGIKSYKRRILEVLQEKKRKGILGKTIVSVLTIFLLIFGNMIAKEADIPVNMLFSDNVVVYDLNDPNLTIEIIEK